MITYPLGVPAAIPSHGNGWDSLRSRNPEGATLGREGGNRYAPAHPGHARPSECFTLSQLRIVASPEAVASHALPIPVNILPLTPEEVLSIALSPWCNRAQILVGFLAVDFPYTGPWNRRILPFSTIHSLPISSCVRSARANVFIKLSRSSGVRRDGPLSTAIPACFSGGKRNGFAKSRSNVTRARPSSAQRLAKSSSLAEVSDWMATVQTSCPSDTRNSRPRVPRFSSNFSFTQPARVPLEQSARATLPPRRRYRPEYPQSSDRGMTPECPGRNPRSPKNQESGKPRSGDLECMASRSSGLGRSRFAPQ